MGQLWVHPRWAHRDLPAPGGTQGCSPGNSSWEGDVTIPEAFETPGLLTFLGHVHVDKHGRAEGVLCCVWGTAVGFGSLAGK